ncbi:MAG: hypothetical protein AAF388_03975 [Bacteroidota bacterium]
MNRVLLFLGILLSYFSTKSQIRHTKGIQTFALGMSLPPQEEGVAYQASYLHFLNRQQFLEAQLSYETLLISQDRDRQFYETVNLPGSPQDELVLGTYTQKNLTKLKGYYLAVNYGHLLFDLNDRLYFHGLAGIKTGFEELLSEESEADILGGITMGPELAIYLAPGMGIALRGTGSYLLGARQPLRWLAGGSLILGF